MTFPLQDGALAWGCEGAVGTRGTGSLLTFCLGGQSFPKALSQQQSITELQEPHQMSTCNPQAGSHPMSMYNSQPGSHQRSTCSPQPGCHQMSMYNPQAGCHQMSMSICQAISRRIRAVNECSILLILLVLFLIDHK